MTSRRRFIQTIAGVPPLLALNPAWAAPDPSRIALVIGNSAYRQAPLDNPANDAAAMRDLLTTAGFTVDSRLDAKRTDLLAAIDVFGKRLQSSEAKLAIFYYAGHGAQIDWRNYLLPVDVVVSSAEQVKNQCVDLGLLLGKMTAAKDKTFVIILDACRDDPFKGGYRPEQKGLSQFDAPVGSLLAYATSPGNVASDGSGKNGLYTENLVRELSVRGAKIEDALKRVRLNVRLSSNGGQIPWETTSLESDVFIFADAQKKLTEAEIEKQLEAEMEEWARIKASKKVDDWVGYLKVYPNGRFAEIAQNRLSRLLADKEKTSAPPSVALHKPSTFPAASAPNTTTTTAAAATPAPAIVLQAGAATSLTFQASANPNSVGTFHLGRQFSVGDSYDFRLSDLFTGVEEGVRNLRITRVDEDADRVEANDGAFVFDLMGNFLRAPGSGVSDIPQQMVSAELQLGKKWAAGWKQDHPKFGRQTVNLDVRIVAFEEVTVPAGTFKAFRIEAHGWVGPQNSEIRQKIWVVPGLITAVRRETVLRNGPRLLRTELSELLSLRQQSLGAGCASEGGGKTRSLVIKSSCG